MEGITINIDDPLDWGTGTRGVVVVIFWGLVMFDICIRVQGRQDKRSVLNGFGYFAQ